MEFTAPDGRREILWVLEIAPREYRVLNVPVWQYGISVGTLVRGEVDSRGRLQYRSLVEPSPGGTVRVIVPEGETASESYLDRILPSAVEHRIGIGPATFLDPGLVAIHVHDKNCVESDVSDMLSALTEAGIIEQWEIADPEPAGDAAPNSGEDDSHPQDFGEALVHPEPTTGREKYFVL